VPESGTIRFQEAGYRLKPHLICRKGLARTFQSVRIFPHLSAHANVQVAALFGRTDRRSVAEANQETVELARVRRALWVGEPTGEGLEIAQPKRVSKWPGR